MYQKGNNSLIITLKVFIILIVCGFQFGCASRTGVDVDERSSPHAYKGRIYQVKAGDTLASIAKKYNINYKDLADFNDIKPPYKIFPSQKIFLDIYATKNGKESGKNPMSSADGRGAASGVPAKKWSDKESINKNKSAGSAALLSAVKWQWPASGKIDALFQSGTTQNKGIDLVGKLGEPVLAAAAGQVVYAGSGLSGYGKLLIIKHNEALLSAYAHNNELLVKEGDFVKGGQRIADMGSSGTDRVKLHFEIRSDGNPVDPLKYLPKRN